MNQLLGRLVDAYLQYLKTVFNPYLILISTIFVAGFIFALWLIRKL